MSDKTTMVYGSYCSECGHHGNGIRFRGQDVFWPAKVPNATLRIPAGCSHCGAMRSVLYDLGNQGATNDRDD